jgi:hypothetical protein
MDTKPLKLSEMAPYLHAQGHDGDGHGNGNGKKGGEEAMEVGGTPKKKVPEANVFWTDHLRML